MLTGMLRVRQWHHAAFKCSSDDPTSRVWKLFFRLLVRSSSSGRNVVPTWMPICCFAYYHLELLNEGNRWCKSWNIFNKYALYPPPSVYSHPPCFSFILRQLNNSRTKTFSNFLSCFSDLRARSRRIFPVGNVFFGLFRHHMNALLEPL